MTTMTIQFNDDGTHDVLIVAPGDGSTTPAVIARVQPILDKLNVRNLSHLAEIDPRDRRDPDPYWGRDNPAGPIDPESSDFLSSASE